MSSSEQYVTVTPPTAGEAVAVAACGSPSSAKVPPVIARVAEEIVIEKKLATGVAGAKRRSPFWNAVIAHGPTCRKLTTSPDTAHAPEALKVTRSPELAVAETTSGP
jgi:hypothetical protein